MSANQLSRSPGLNFRFFFQILITWAGFTAWTMKDHMPNTLLVLLFALGSAGLSLTILHLMDYFSKTRLLPRQSDLFLIMTALPLAGVVMYGIMIAIFDRFPISLSEITVRVARAHEARALSEVQMRRLRTRVVEVLTRWARSGTAVEQEMAARVDGLGVGR